MNEEARIPSRTESESEEYRLLNPHVFEFDCEHEVRRIGQRVCTELVKLRRRGVVIGMSGGVDSSVCAALMVRALGTKKVLGLVMPESESSPASERLAYAVAGLLGIEVVREEITAPLEALGAYRIRDEAIRRVIKQFGPGWKSSIGIAGGLSGGFNRFDLIVQSPEGVVQSVRLPYREYLAIVAATNYKQRLRKTIEYFHADRINYAVIGTPNLLEYDQGFFVKNGDGAADLKPIAHLYKTQVYKLARHLGLPEEVCTAIPTTDTYSLPLGQDEFYFALPYAKLDLALYAYVHGLRADTLATAIGVGVEQAQWVYRDITAKRRHADYLHAAPILFNVQEAT
ncbi:MAG: NAD(+) synthase [Acidiferrobacteraceae bacterium]